jgi:ketosteroid isomerase-like protein
MSSTSPPSSTASVRGDALRTLLQASVTGDASAVADLVTEDVVGWSPNLMVESREQLLAALDVRDDSFSGVEFHLAALDHIGDKAIAEWRVGADHTGPLFIDDDLAIESTGRRLHLSGVTVAEFDGNRICAFRSYFDDLALIEQALAGV